MTDVTSIRLSEGDMNAVKAIQHRHPSLDTVSAAIRFALHEAARGLRMKRALGDVIDSWDIDETTSFDLVESEVGPVAVITYHTTGLQFTTTDWQGAQPQSPDEIADFDWVCTDGRPAIMMSGLPVILE